MTSLVVQTSFLGDMVLTTPCLHELASRGPVDVVATPAAAALLVNNPDVRRVIVYDKRGADRGLRGFRRVARAMRESRAEIAYLAQGSLRSAALAMAAGIPSRVGFSTSSGRALYTRAIPYRRDLHHAARLLQLADPARVPDVARLRPRLYPGEPERSAVAALLDAAGVTAGETLVALAPGSVWATKRWPEYPALAHALQDAARIVVIGSRADVALASAIADAAGPRTVNATGALSLLASAELIGRCRVLVTNDSAPQHLASAMGTPTLTIFGPTVPEFGFGPLAPHSIVVQRDGLPCRPCDPHGPPACPLKHWNCMRELAPGDVAARVRHLLEVTSP